MAYVALQSSSSEPAEPVEDGEHVILAYRSARRCVHVQCMSDQGRQLVPMDVVLNPELEHDEAESSLGGKLGVTVRATTASVGIVPAEPRRDELEAVGFSASIGESPVCFRLSALLAARGLPLPADMIVYEGKYDLWLVPHRVSIVRHHGLREIISVGIAAKYAVEGATCSVVSLMPEPQYVDRGSLRFRAATDATGQLSLAQNLERVGPIRGADLKLGVDASVGASLAFDLSVASPLISAVGKGSRQARWQFEADRTPLHGRDIETWSLLLLPRGQGQLSYELSTTITHRLAFFPTSRESRPIKIDCTLLDDAPAMAALTLPPGHG